MDTTWEINLHADAGSQATQAAAYFGYLGQSIDSNLPSFHAIRDGRWPFRSFMMVTIEAKTSDIQRCGVEVDKTETKHLFEVAAGTEEATRGLRDELQKGTRRRWTCGSTKSCRS